MSIWPERFAPSGGKAASHTELEHLERYRWAATKVSGRILDAACGTGYGSAVLSTKGEVTGIDYDDDALASARALAPRASILKTRLPVLPFPDESFDYVVSFETVEHIIEDAEFVAQLSRVLSANGTMLISTPNGQYDTGENPWHVREYVLSDFLLMLEENGFAETAVYGQRTPPDTSSRLMVEAIRVVARFPTLCRPGTWWDDRIHGSSSVRPYVGPRQPLFWVICARKTGLPSAAASLGVGAVEGPT